VKLEVFEGPLDLLLHLIRINEVDIADIPIAAISDQYLQYLELMRDLDIDVAAEYLLMAATLAQIKSRMLLPAAEEGEGEEGPDPREELARRLAEYAAFKEVAQGLDRRARLGRDVFAGRLEPESLLEEIPAEPQAHEVHLERVSVQDRMHHVMDRLRGAPAGTALFEDVMREGPRVRHYVVMTFLAILELTRLQEVRIFQNADDAGCPVGPIRIRLITLDDPAPA
jgi:segregation and condensation protein A